MAYKIDKNLENIIAILTDMKTHYDTKSRASLNKNYCDGLVEGLDEAIKEIEHYDASNCGKKGENKCNLKR